MNMLNAFSKALADSPETELSSWAKASGEKIRNESASKEKYLLPVQSNGGKRTKSIPFDAELAWSLLKEAQDAGMPMTTALNAARKARGLEG